MFIVGGKFDNDGGKPSHFISEMMKFLGCMGVNGGYVKDLSADFGAFTDILIWMPEVDNNEDKILPTIKVKNPHTILVQSKRISEGNYTESDVIGRLLKSHSLLGIAIEKLESGYWFKLLDPLGNIHCSTDSLEILCSTLKKRVTKIKNMTRLGSKKVGPVKDFVIDKDFVEVVKKFGKQFSTFVNAINPNRLLGNASTRCASGFPAVKEGERIFVSKRNVDKQTLCSKDFVEVSLPGECVEFYGDNKPSVDTPIQLLLFSYFPYIKYMIHGHVYVKNAPMTEHKIPCGFLEEVIDVLAVVNDAEVEEFSINLRGHGCLVCCKDLSYFDKIEFVGRPFPES
tara:strand:- start:23788 stop:24810 length:1023 start_codon:yes stop_codon:yes gene_type:complete